MSTPHATLHDVVTTLRAENLLDDGDAALAYLENRQDTQPWYIRTMVGFGAWLASLLLIGFVASIGLLVDGGYAVAGLILIVGAILLRRRSDNDFLVQCALAASLAGQALFALGVVQSIGHEVLETLLGLVLVVSSALFFLFPDRIHRVLMVTLAAGSLTTLFYVWELNALVPVLGPAFTAALLLLDRKTPMLFATWFAPLLRPLMNGLMLSAFGVLLISTAYVLPELGLDYQLYPRPWISTLLLGGLFLYLGAVIRPTLTGPGNSRASSILFGMMAVIVICAWAMPGLLLGLIVVLLGAASGRRTYTGAGIGFIALFLATFFYGIEVTLLTKSIVLVATGGAILLSRWVILKVAAMPGTGEESRV